MKRKNIIVVGIVSLILFIGVASYFWSLYFSDYENKLEEQVLEQNEGLEFRREVELINSGSTTYLNAKNTDDEMVVPTYYFQVKNKSDKEFGYVIYLENVKANDGCTEVTTFSRDELEYELKLNNKTVKVAGLDTIKNNVLDTNIITKYGVNDYSLKVRLKSDTTDYDNKHFHYTITMKEKK